MNLDFVKKFVELVDANATTRAFKKRLGMTRVEYLTHLKQIDYYRSILDKEVKSVEEVMSEPEQQKLEEVVTEEEEGEYEEKIVDGSYDVEKEEYEREHEDDAED